jgi:O-antigen biosynthesis alpha-1,2-rhamnosyltransferase
VKRGHDRAKLRLPHTPSLVTLAAARLENRRVTTSQNWAAMKNSTNTDRPIRRILLECTATYFTGLNTGIERVVRNVARESTAIGRECGIECIPIVRIEDRFLTLPWTPGLELPETIWRKSLTPWWPSAETWNHRAWTRLVQRCGTRLHKILYPRSVVRKITHLRWSWQGETVIPGDGDTLVLLDTWWNRNIWPAVAKARHRGAVIGVVAYDLLPITHAEHFKPDVSETFAASLNIALEQGDYFVAISNTVRDALREYAVCQGPPRHYHRASFASFRLGSTLDRVYPNRPVRGSLRRAFAGTAPQQPYLTVGTIEPRKNHALELDAFEQVWARYPDARLCIVGRIGWMCEELIERIVRHPQYRRSLLMFNDLTDSELAYCYQHAKALVFPSRAEGFGLPIVEALQHGLPTLVSDIPIHREVGREFCTYFDPRSPDELAALITDIEATGQFPLARQPDDYALPSWTESTREFLGKCLVACGRGDGLAAANRAA